MLGHSEGWFGDRWLCVRYHADQLTEAQQERFAPAWGRRPEAEDDQSRVSDIEARVEEREPLGPVDRLMA